MINIELTMTEIMQAAQVGIMRRMQRLRSKIPLSHGLKEGTEWQLFIDGALSECALAKYLNVYWAGCGEINGLDVADVEVRSTKYHNGMMIMHKSDKDDVKYYLLTGSEGKYIIRGWIYGREGKQDKYWTVKTDRPPAYWIPQNVLHDMSE